MKTYLVEIKFIVEETQTTVPHSPRAYSMKIPVEANDANSATRIAAERYRELYRGS